MKLASLAVCLGAVTACAVETSPATDVAESAVRPSDGPVTFEPCSLSPGVHGVPGTVSCARIEVPLDWSKPTGRRISFFVKRIQGNAPGPHKQLWLLAGGPGAAGDSFDSQARMFLSADPALDLYIPDHRGTGRSTKLECSGSGSGSASGASCIEELITTWGRDGLAAFSTTSAARDVGYGIERTREPGQQVHIYGVSYGTYLAQRYLQVFPRQPTSVTLDGLCQAGLCSLLKYGYWSDKTAQRFMRECGEDAICRAKLGSDPVARAKDAIAIGEAGTCAGLERLRGAGLKNALHGLIRIYSVRALVPALIYRVLRCDDGDVVALRNFVDLISRPPPAPPAGTAAPASLTSGLLASNIAFSEMMEVPAITRDELRALMSTSVFTSFSPFTHDQFDLWPRYEHDEYVGAYPDTDVPVLLLNGTLDSATPIEFAEAIAPHYTKPHQTFVSIPRATHGVFYGSWTTEGTSCGFELFKQFIAAPTSPLDTSCTASVLTHDFAGDAVIAQRYLGTDDLWETPTAPRRKPAESNVPDAELAEALRRVANETGF